MVVRVQVPLAVLNKRLQFGQPAPRAEVEAHSVRIQFPDVIVFWSCSSAWLEHVSDKDGVVGSNPTATTLSHHHHLMVVVGLVRIKYYIIHCFTIQRRCVKVSAKIILKISMDYKPKL